MCLLQLASGSSSQAYYASGPGRRMQRSSRLGLWDRFPLLMASSWSCHPSLPQLPLGALLSGLETLPRMRSCKEVFEASLAMRGKSKISPATALHWSPLHSQCTGRTRPVFQNDLQQSSICQCLLEQDPGLSHCCFISMISPLCS